jgi:hypothetical protein
MNNIYKLTIQGLAGAAYFSYKDGALLEVLLSFKELPSIWSDFRQCIPADERYVLAQHVPKQYHIEILKPRTVSDKLAAFCMTFRRYRNSAYSTKKQERTNIADVMMSDKLLEAYFSCNDYPLTYAKSISDYIRHYNFIRDIATNGKPAKSRFPDVYDREFEKTLEGETLSAYWQHLNKLGWRKIEGLWRKE